MLKLETILVGGFSEMIELCELCEIRIVGIIDHNTDKNSFPYPILGTDNDAERLYDTYKSVPVVITPDLPAIRLKLATHYAAIGYSFLNVISPKAIVSRSCKMGKGVIVQSGVNISADVCIGDFVRLNVNANVMHDCTIGNYTTIAPNAVLLGKVIVEDDCYIGANSTILPEVIVHESSVVGAGSVAVKNVPAGHTVKGVPAK
jgi:sugar O-acyltransferase (sialic acid O-acetyltransferase NeuD family)